MIQITQEKTCVLRKTHSNQVETNAHSNEDRHIQHIHTPKSGIPVDKLIQMLPDLNQNAGLTKYITAKYSGLLEKYGLGSRK